MTQAIPMATFQTVCEAFATQAVDGDERGSTLNRHPLRNP
jgi:hypothetical protein